MFYINVIMWFFSCQNRVSEIERKNKVSRKCIFSYLEKHIFPYIEICTYVYYK